MQNISLWIGLNDLFYEGEWIWIDEYSNYDINLSEYYWSDNEPDNNGPYSHCSYIKFEDNNNLNIIHDGNCLNEFQFLCNGMLYDIMLMIVFVFLCKQKGVNDSIAECDQYITNCWQVADCCDNTSLF